MSKSNINTTRNSKKHKALQAMAREGRAFPDLKSGWALQWVFQFSGIFIRVK